LQKKVGARNIVRRQHVLAYIRSKANTGRVAGRTTAQKKKKEAGKGGL